MPFNGIVTLTTDFGTDSPYVAQMKGVLLCCPWPLTLVDVTHAIGPQDIRHGALVLADVCPRFPVGTLHLAVIDPGVGTEREIVYFALNGRHYLGPDNGLFSLLVARQPPESIRALTNPALWASELSATFHGRDILAPVASRLIDGLAVEELGPPRASLVGLDWPQVETRPRGLTGEVISVDSFGNLITNITTEHLSAALDPTTVEVSIASHKIVGLVRTYGERSSGQPIALIGSSDRLEVAVVDGDAGRCLATGRGAKVSVVW